MYVCNNELREQILTELKFGERETLSRFYDDNLQLKFYKYRSGTECDIEALKANKIWMGCAAYIDDVYDSAFIPKEDWIKLYHYMCSKEPKFKEERFAKVMNSQGKVFQNAMYICSLAETARNEDLWTRYAGAHSGFCIEYSAHALIHAGWVPFPVYYGEINKSILDFSGKSKSDILFDIILTKSKDDWQQQGEWRMIAWNATLGIEPGEKGSLIDMPIPTKIFCGQNASDALKKALNTFSATSKVPVVFGA